MCTVGKDRCFGGNVLEESRIEEYKLRITESVASAALSLYRPNTVEYLPGN